MTSDEYDEMKRFDIELAQLQNIRKNMIIETEKLKDPERKKLEEEFVEIDRKIDEIETALCELFEKEKRYY